MPKYNNNNNNNILLQQVIEQPIRSEYGEFKFYPPK